MFINNVFAIRQLQSCVKPGNSVKYIVNQNINCYSSNNKEKGEVTGDPKDQNKKGPVDEKPVKPPEEPTTCCVSGCANCVWLDYAETLCKYYQDGGEKAIKEINERIADPNIKAYILHEIRMRNKK